MRLDPNSTSTTTVLRPSGYGVENAADVRKVLKESGNVLAVLQGPSHKNDHSDIDGIHYGTLVAMVEGSGADDNGYSVVSLASDETIRIDGLCNQADYGWKVGI